MRTNLLKSRLESRVSTDTCLLDTVDANLQIFCSAVLAQRYLTVGKAFRKKPFLAFHATLLSGPCEVHFASTSRIEPLDPHLPVSHRPCRTSSNTCFRRAACHPGSIAIKSPWRNFEGGFSTLLLPAFSRSLGFPAMSC